MPAKICLPGKHEVLGGGGYFRTLTIYNFKENEANLCALPEIYKGTIWYGMSLFVELDVSTANIFWPACVLKFGICLFLTKKFNLFGSNFYIFRSFWHHFIGLDCFWVIFNGFLTSWKNQEIQDGWSKMALFGSHDVIKRHLTSSFLVAYLKGNFWNVHTYIYIYILYRHTDVLYTLQIYLCSFNIPGVTEKEEGVEIVPR